MSEMEVVSEPITTIQSLKNGPYIVRGVFTLTDSNGNVVAPDKDTVALCRCGASADKPFCDGTHSRIGFTAAAEVVPESEE
jgi:CDGSH-type Zn-finger protein